MQPTIIIPYRDREDQLFVFAEYFSNALFTNELIFVKQEGTALFNRGALLNAGVKYAESLGHTHVILHDVDMLPCTIETISYYNQGYECAHLCMYASQFPKPLGMLYFGGVNAFSIEVFKRINGFSNQFWGWGGEDNDLLNRCIAGGFKPDYLPGRYISMCHEPQSKANFENNRRKFKHSGPQHYTLDGYAQAHFKTEINKVNNVTFVACYL